MNIDHFLGVWLAWIVPATIQLSLLVVLVTPIAYLLRGLPAQFRYVLWLLVFVKVFITPDASAPWAIGTWGMPEVLDGKLVVVRLFANPMTAAHGAALPWEDVGVRSTVLPFDSMPLSQGTPFVIAAALFLVWLFGAAAMACAIIRDQWQLRQDLRMARVVADGPLYFLLTQIAREYGIARVPRLALSAVVQTPFICGVWRQTIVLPAALPGSLTAGELRAVFAHELVHARRRDTIMCWAQMIAVSIFWFHPLVWFAHRMINGERELAVDETVLRRGLSRAAEYGRAILRVVEEASGRCGLVTAGFLGGVLHAPDLDVRIARLFALPRVRATSSMSIWFGVFVFAAVMLPMGRPAVPFAHNDSPDFAAPLRQ